MIIRPRAALLTLYGDYALRRTGGAIGIGSLIELLRNFALSEQAIRSAVSRMCQAGLFNVRHIGNKSYYSLTKDGIGLLETGEQRIFDRKQNHWNGNWNIVVYSIPEKKRSIRNELRQELSWLGYGALCEATWISPNNLSGQVDIIARRLHIKDYVQVFNARHLGLSDTQNIVSRCWDLTMLHTKYADFINKYQPKVKHYNTRLQTGTAISPSECFVERFELVHEYRKLPFFDPDLPLELLPGNWLRPQAGTLFDEYHGLLTEKANEYFDSVSKNYQDARKT